MDNKFSFELLVRTFKKIQVKEQNKTKETIKYKNIFHVPRSYVHPVQNISLKSYCAYTVNSA